MELAAMILAFWMLSFRPAFPLSSFTFIKRLFSSSSFSATRVVWSAYLRLLILLPQSWFQLVLNPAWHFIWCTLLLQETVKDREAWHAAVHGITKSWTPLNDCIHSAYTLHISYMLQSMGSQRVGHHWMTAFILHTLCI